MNNFNLSKLLIKIGLLSILSFIAINQTTAQKNYKWSKKVSPAKPIPERFADADAVMIYSTEIRQTKFEDYKLFSRNVFKQRIKIQTEKGLEDYGRIILPKKNNMKIFTLDARTIKQDGSFVDLDSKTEIKEIELTDKDDLIDKRKYKVFSIPGVEVGDEIEIVCIQEGFTLEQGGTVFLHKTIPCLKSKFIIETFDKRIVPKATNRNRMPVPKIANELNSFSARWMLENVPGLYEERGNISAKSLPCLVYEINLDNLYFTNSSEEVPNIKNWNELLHYNNRRYYDVNIRSQKKFDEAINNILSKAKSDSTFDQLAAIQNHLNDKEYATIPEKQASEGIEFFLNHDKTDFNTLIRMYKSVLDKLGVEYYFGAARSKYLGPIDLDFPTSMQISDYIFVVKDGEQSHILPTMSRRSNYLINEIPIYLYGTDIYMVDFKDKKVFTSIKLPENKKNNHIRKVKAKVNLAEGSILYSMDESFSGAKSTDYRDDYFDANNNEKLQKDIEEEFEILEASEVKNIELTEYPTTFPYKFNVTFDYKTENQISELEDKVYKISLENLFDHAIEGLSKNRLLDYYPRYTFTDSYTIVFEFDQPVKFSNKENIALSENTPVAAYTLTADQINPTSIVVKSKYTIRRNQIKVDEISRLIDVNAKAELGDNEGLIIELN